MTAPTHFKSPRRPERLALVALFAALLSLVVFGGVVSFLCLLVAAVMGWSRPFIENAAKGKPTMGSKGRIFVGGVMTALAFIMLPKGAETAPREEKAPALTPAAPRPVSPKEAEAMERRNAVKIAELIAGAKTLDERDYEGRLNFWQEITALAPGNAEYARKKHELLQQIAALQPAIEHPEQGAQLVKFVGRKEGFGNVLVIDVTIRNDSLSNLKDFQIVCESMGPSGTVTDQNTRILYGVVEARKTRTFRKLNMGFVNQQSVNADCRVDQATIA